MKKLILLLLFFMPLLGLAKFYNGKIVYNNGKVSEVQVNLPLKASKKSISVKINNKKESVKISDIKYLIVTSNSGEDFVFKRGKLKRVNKDGEIKSASLLGKDVDGLTLVDKVYDDIIVSLGAQQYTIKKVKGKETMYAVSESNSAGAYGYVLSKPDDENIYFFFNSAAELKISLKRTKDILFSKCPEFAESINYKELDKKQSFVHQIAEEYNNCVKK